MNALTPITVSRRADFPGVVDWAYLDSAATAQKPQIVIDAIAAASSTSRASAPSMSA